jgi:hypothetical protein
MGMSAEVLAIGPFQQRLLPFLDQPPERHATTREGAMLVVSVFEAFEGSTRSRELAACVGVEPWDFKTHVFDPWRADLAALRASHAAHRVERFIRLREAGFEFFFRPNG